MRRIFLSMRRLVGIFAARSAVNMPDYIHDRDAWPAFCWSAERLAEPLAAVARRQGRFAGRMEALGFRLREEAVLETLTEDVLNWTELEAGIPAKYQTRKRKSDEK